jgi:Leu/Phe-tRNA-protein transferase
MAKKPTKAAKKVNKENTLRIRLTDGDRALFDKCAADRGLSTSAWVRMELLRLAKEK